MQDNARVFLPPRRHSALPLLAGLAAGLTAAWSMRKPLHYTRLMITSLRQPLSRTPAAIGLPYSEVAFPAEDGVPLRGWLLPRAENDGRPAPAVVIVHGWPWNRLGNLKGYAGLPDRDVDLLEPAAALQRAGLHVLLFDLRNHGTSGAAPPVTFGVKESRDLVGALAFLRSRPEVDGTRIGALGYSMGANTVLYAIPRCRPVRAAMLVQPVHALTFARRFVREQVGPAGPLLLALAGPLHRALGAPPLAAIDPTVPAAQLQGTVAQYIQGHGDPWGTLEDVQAFQAATPDALPLIITPSTERYEGYHYVNRHLAEVVTFFKHHL